MPNIGVEFERIAEEAGWDDCGQACVLMEGISRFFLPSQKELFLVWIKQVAQSEKERKES